MHLGLSQPPKVEFTLRRSCSDSSWLSLHAFLSRYIEKNAVVIALPMNHALMTWFVVRHRHLQSVLLVVVRRHTRRGLLLK